MKRVDTQEGTTAVMEELTTHAQRVRDGLEQIKPGTPHRISDAATPGDGVWQGDLGIEIVAVDHASSKAHIDQLVKAGTVQPAKDRNPQLVPGNTQGAKHCLDSLDGVDLYEQTKPNELIGPLVYFRHERTILHPTHGAVTVPAGMACQIRYQREYDAEQRRERRSLD